MEDAIGYVAVEVGEAEDSEEINVPWIKESIEQGIQRLPIDGNQSHHGSPTIHRVRYHMRAGNKRAFTPQLVSIGPYHYGSKTLKKMEALKLKYLHDLMKRSSIENPLFRCIESVRRKAAKAKKQYSRTVQLKSEEFVKMMVVDGCFIIEFLIKYVMDPDQMNILKTEMPSLVNDLLMVENQIPFFIVKDIFGLLNISVKQGRGRSPERRDLSSGARTRGGKDPGLEYSVIIPGKGGSVLYLLWRILLYFL